MGGGYLREKRVGGGQMRVFVEKNTFIPENSLQRRNAHRSKGKLTAASGAHKAGNFKFLLQRGSFSLQGAGSGFWAVCSFRCSE